MLELATVFQTGLIDLLLFYPFALVVCLVALWLPDQARVQALAIGAIFVAALKFTATVAAPWVAVIIPVRFLAGIVLLAFCWVQARRLSSSASMSIGGARAAFEIAGAGIGLSLAPLIALSGGASRFPITMMVGLLCSTTILVLIGFFLTSVVRRFRWLGWIAVVVLLYFAIWETYSGLDEILGHTLPQIPA